MRRLLVLIMITAFFSSCKVMQPNKMFELPDDFEYSEFKPSNKEYIIQPFDKLSLQIFTNDGIRLIDFESNSSNLGRSGGIVYLVEYDGRVKVPVLGRIQVSGLTIKEAEQMLEIKYAEYYQKPFVLVNVVNRRVIVYAGGSANGQIIPITEENFTLIEAIAIAGGLSDLSKAYHIRLIRGDLAHPEVYLLNLSELADLKEVNLLLEANDIIYVETRPKYASRLLSEISPYMSILTTILILIQIFK